MFTIRIYNGDHAGENAFCVGAEKPVLAAVEADKPVLASEIIKRYGIDCALPCGGKGSCGKCRIKVLGSARAASTKERGFLSAEELESGVRLACFCTIAGDAEIHILSQRRQVILGGTGSLNIAGGKKETADLDSLEASKSLHSGVGIACDIGTTTVVMCLYDLDSGRVLAQEAELNCQRAFGADVISRITACDEGGVGQLSRLIQSQIAGMAERCLKKASHTAILKAVVTGNTVMLHIYEGLDPHSLAVSPFTMLSAFGRFSTEKLLGAPVYIPQCIGAYVGADVLCAVLSAPKIQEGYSLLADIGTNGEMALSCPDGTLLCCSAPAGPAFEGAGIFMGMNAAEGAVSAVRLNESGQIECDIIGGVCREAGGEGKNGLCRETAGAGDLNGSGSVPEAVGICGSGLIDCVAVMKKRNAIDDTGYLPEDFTIPGTRVKITQLDIRQVQLAKAAICAGIQILLYKADISAEQIEKLFIAGGFGNYLNLESAAAIGLMPPELSAVSEFIGNGALNGAAMILLSEDAKTEAESLSRRASELHLATDPDFTKRYIDAMSF